MAVWSRLAKKVFVTFSLGRHSFRGLRVKLDEMFIFLLSRSILFGWCHAVVVLWWSFLKRVKTDMNNKTNKIQLNHDRKYLILLSSLWRGCSIDCHEENYRHNVHPVLGQERAVVLHLPGLHLPLLFLNLLDECSCVRHWSILHMLHGYLSLEIKIVLID